ncbi:hypothetical protein FQR65_LT04231 [Abscondita terminalis]|nr:hypothetical protein FQR65_LT04231 [Abscondita terminalis]
MTTNITVHLVKDNGVVYIPFTPKTIAEDVCLTLCKQLSIGPVARHLFALRITGKQIYIPSNSKFTGKHSYDFRIRYKMANTANLKEIDKNAYDYYFYQVRSDVLENKIPDLVYENCKRELVGLGVTDMYRVMIEKDLTRESVESDYKNYIPKEVLKRHSIFIKKPIHDSLGNIEKAGHDSWYIKKEYLKQLETMAPEYLAEQYKAITDQDGTGCDICVKVSAFHATQPGIRVSFESGRQEWQHICSIEDLCFISVREDSTVEISRRNGIPFYLKFFTLPDMHSFVSVLDGYYRLMCKWIFNLCKDLPTYSLQKLYSMKCHGPVGGEFSYAKLQEKRNNHPGCFIIRESESKFNVYYIDVCMKDSKKPKTFKLEQLLNDEFIFNDDLNKYKSVHQLIAAYSDPEGYIYLGDCLPPSEYDKSPLLLCQDQNVTGDLLTDSSEVQSLLSYAPLCINSKDFQVFKVVRFFYKVSGNLTEIYTDLNYCKLSHLGLEYQGYQAQTESGIRCQLWKTENPIHKVEIDFGDDNFPDFSKKKSKNYCRNPNKDPKGPWCYTLDPNLIDETCALPICTYIDCKITGPGIEYAGIHSKSLSERNCLKWNKDRKKVKHKDQHIKIEKFDNTKFPDENIQKAKKHCRNPDGDIGGPWCFVENEDTMEIEREFCDIPFCDIFESLIFSLDYSTYSHYFSFNHTESNFTFGVKLWDSDTYNDANARLVLSLFALPLTRKHIHQSEFAIEISISNNNCSLSGGYKSGLEEEPSFGLLKSTDFTYFSLTWSSGFITLQKLGETKSIFLNEFKFKNTLLGFLKDRFYFYSFQGTNILWNFPFTESDSCTVHTTGSQMHQSFIPLRETEIGRDLIFHIRALHSANILFVTSPPVSYPCVDINFFKLDNMTRVVATEFEGGPKILLHETEFSSIINYWEWNEFSFTVFADTLSVYWRKDVSNHLLVEVKHHIFKLIRWFSPSSTNNIAHWTFYCKPPLFANPPNALLPECVLNKDEPDYKGLQAITSEGLPCLPWVSKLLPADVESMFPNKTIFENQNYCRNPNNEPGGTYCYALQQNPNITFTKQHCHIRFCKSAECKMAGTGNDYVGKLNVTRSNRTCANWSEYLSKNPEHSNFLNDTLYPDLKLEDAGNFCRNPSKSIGGSWCFTTDLNITRDICNVRDCNKPEECTVVVRDYSKGRFVYILPEWKEGGVHGGLRFAIKQWDPDLLEGLFVQIKGLVAVEILTLVIGAEYNEKIALYYSSDLIKEKTFPHLLPAGRWAFFWLQMRQGEIMLGYEGVPEPFFEWKHEEPDKVFEPVFLSYNSVYGHPVGVYFPCESCHLEVTSTTYASKLMSLGLWSPTVHDFYSNVTLHLRGNGIASIHLYTFPESDAYEIELNNANSKIKLTRNQTRVFYGSDTNPLYTINTWTTFVIMFSENAINLTRNGSSIMLYEFGQLTLIYWFAVTAKDGDVVWSANCNPPDIDGNPKDGGWSQWSGWHCTVSCGGGEGYRTRTCSNPKPNIFGKLCEGSPTSTGVCNTFTCGDISPETIDKIRDGLQTEHVSLVIKEHESVVIHNNNNLVDIINRESPDSTLEWILNGVPLIYKSNRVEFKFNNIYITNSQVSDIGVYMCILYRINKQKVVLKVVSLVITTERDVIAVRATQELTLITNSVTLGYVYSDLNQKWLLNGSVYVDYGTTTLAAVGTEHIKITNTSHSGVWKCVVEQPDLGMKWVTNIVKVRIKRPPSIYTHLREDAVTAPFFSWIKSDVGVLIAIISIVVFVCSLVALGVYLYFKYCTLPMSNAEKRRQKKEGLEGITTVYRTLWRVTKGKKMEVAMKVLKYTCYEQHLKGFLKLADRWGFLQSNALVRLYGVTVTGPVSMVLEQVRLGPLDVYLRDNKSRVKAEDLIEAASNLASALWYLEENGFVHGNIRCRKILVSSHEENSFSVKLGDPGVAHTYTSKDVHWIPVECYSNLEYAKRFTAADVWAVGTTLCEIFMFGQTITETDDVDCMEFYVSGNRLAQPSDCPNDIYQLMQECWETDPHRRKQPQALMRDVNNILYQVYNSRRTLLYTKMSSKSNLNSQIDAESLNSFFSTATGISDELISISDEDDLSTLSEDHSYNNQSNFNHDTANYEYDISTILSSYISGATSATSLDSSNSMQCIFELDADCNVILQGRIGQGFYGEVYKGTLESVGDGESRQVAVKKLKSSAVSTSLQDFEREISIMKTLKHPNIVEILGVFQEPEVSLVMEFVQHGSLQSYLKIYRDSLTTKQLLKYAYDIAEGMAYLGTKHIVHRDLAARNILVVDQDHVKISDFGLAQVMGSNEYYILKTNRELPIKWYAPESLRDGRFSSRSDVWSYGVTMCEIFVYGDEPKLQIETTEAPSIGQEQQNLLKAIESGARLPCPRLCPQSVYARIIYPCWQGNPHERPTFQQLLVEIEDLLTLY